MRGHWTQFHTNMKSSFAVGVTEHRRIPREAVQFPPMEILRPRLDASLCVCRESTSARTRWSPAPRYQPSPRVPLARAAPNANPRAPPSHQQHPRDRAARACARATAAAAAADERINQRPGACAWRAGLQRSERGGDGAGAGRVPVPLPLPAAPGGPSRVSRPDPTAGTGEPVPRRGRRAEGPSAWLRGAARSVGGGGCGAGGLAGCWALRGSRGGRPRRECCVLGERNRSPAVCGLRGALHPAGRWQLGGDRHPATTDSWRGLCRSQSAVWAKRALEAEGGRPLLTSGSFPNFSRLNWSTENIDLFGRRYAVESLLVLVRY